MLKRELWFLMLKWNKTILSSYRTGSGFLTWTAELFLSFEPDYTSDHSRDGGFVPAVTLTFDPPGYRLLVTLVFQQINLILPLTLTLSSCGQNLNRNMWRKCNILLKSMQCLSHWFNKHINDAQLYSGNEGQCVFLDKKEKKNHKKQFFHLSECFLRKSYAW